MCVYCEGGKVIEEQVNGVYGLVSIVPKNMKYILNVNLNDTKSWMGSTSKVSMIIDYCPFCGADLKARMKNITDKCNNEN